MRGSVEDSVVRVLRSDPFTVPPNQWELGESFTWDPAELLPPVEARKVVGVGRSFAAHARELGNPVPDEPILFLKSPDCVIATRETIQRPASSRRVEYEGEVAVVLRSTLRSASAAEARAASLGITAAVDVTARDLQRSDVTFARAKSFDTFCPLGPEILVGGGGDDTRFATRINGQVRQQATLAQLTLPLWDLVAWISRNMTLKAGDVVLTGTPAGVGELKAGDRIEVEIDGIGILENPVEDQRSR